MTGSFKVLEEVVVDDTPDSPAASMQNGEVASPMPPATTCWWLTGGISASIVALSATGVIWWLKFRRRVKQTEKERIILNSDLPIIMDGELEEK